MSDENEDVVKNETVKKWLVRGGMASMVLGGIALFFGGGDIEAGATLAGSAFALAGAAVVVFKKVKG